MVAKIAGVALAAVMGACALGAERAEASSVQFSFRYSEDIADYNVLVDARGSFNIDGRGAEYTIFEHTYSYTPGVADIATTRSIKTFGGNLYVDGSGVFESLPYATYSYSDQNLSVKASFLADGTLVPLGSFSYGSATDVRGGTDIIEATISSVNVVPLPAAAPLFGSALLVLSCAALMRGRAEKVQAG